MGLTPTTPSLREVSRSFWERREGKAGAVVLGALGIGAGAALIAGWGIVLPFLIGVAGNTIQLALMIGIIAVLTSPVWSKRVRMVATLLFQQTMRWAVGAIIPIDPIGILREHIKKIREQTQIFSKAVEAIAGTRQRITDDMNRQKAGILKNKGLVDSVEQQLKRIEAQIEKLTDEQESTEMSLKRDGLKMQRENYARMAAFQYNTLKMEQPLLTAANKMYNQMSRIRTLGEYKAEGLTQQADMEAQRRALILDAKTGLSAGSRILKTDPQEQMIYEQTLEYLNNDAAATLGAMEDFNRWADKYLTDMDIQNDSAAQEAFRMFDAMENKLKAPKTTPPTQISAGAQPAVKMEDVFSMPELDSPEILKLLK